MAIDFTIWAADQLAIQDDLPDSIVFDSPDGRTIVCMSGQSAQSRKLEEEGFYGVYDLTILVLSSAFAGNVPATRAKFTHARSGLRYRIEKISDSPDMISYQIDAMQVTG